MYVHVSKHFKYLYVYICVYIYMYIHVYIYIYTYIHIYVCKCPHERAGFEEPPRGWLSCLGERGGERASGRRLCLKNNTATHSLKKPFAYATLFILSVYSIPFLNRALCRSRAIGKFVLDL